MKLVLKELKAKDNWDEYHRIKKTEIFDHLPHITYELNHPCFSDKNNYHFCFVLDDQVIGVFQFELLGKHRAAIRTIAIDKAFKGKGYGYGGILLEQGERIIKDKGVKLIQLHANPKALDFYKKYGYKEMFFDDPSINIETVDMGKNI